MSDTDEQSEKTEEPTAKRLADARKKGQVATSKEVNTWIMLTAGTLVLLTVGPSMGTDIKALLTPFLERPHAIPTDFEHLRDAWFSMMQSLAWILLVGAALIYVAALATGIVQHGPIFSADSIKPDIGKLSLIKGFKRLFSLKSVVEFVKGMVKLSIVTLAMLLLVAPQLAPMTLFVGQEPGQIVDHIYELSLEMLIAVLAAMAIIAGIDFIYQKYEFTKKQRMTKREIKEEHKQLEGDPMVKARLRSIRLEKARKRMMAAVPKADVVVTNPTHVAVALEYDQDEMEAPVVVAKGADLIAKRMREIAQENDVPIVENPPLARTLYDTTEIDQMIPIEQYQAVARIISYIWRLKGKTSTPPPRPAAI